MHNLPAWVVLATAIALPNLALADCPALSGKPQVFVKAKTPVRKGPGLNYQVSSFLEKGRCLPFSEVSMDKRWVLIAADETYGWVPMGRLAEVSQAGAQTIAPKTAAVGSGQTRGEARVIKQTILLAGPNKEAGPKRVLPLDLMVVPLTTTPDGDWIEVRDERGQTGWVLARELRGDALADLPIHESMADQAPTPVPFDSGIVRSRPGRSGVGVALTAAVFAGALAPTQSLDSDGATGRRRYDVAALAPSTTVELEMMDLGPLTARVAYSIAFLTGIKADGDLAAGGNQHDLRIRAGLPINVGPAVLTPEVGYQLALFDFDSVLSDQPFNVTFLSTTSHLATAGLRLRWFLDRSLQLEADAGGSFGTTSLSPRPLSDGGFTVGAYGTVGAQYFMGDIIGLTMRYILDWRKADYTGGGQLDPTITQGTVSGLSHGLMVGLSFLLAG